MARKYVCEIYAGGESKGSTNVTVPVTDGHSAGRQMQGASLGHRRLVQGTRIPVIRT
jgi:hypothetical protein